MLLAVKLVECIERQKLDARPVKNLFNRNFLKNLLRYTIGAMVAVVVGVAEQIAGIPQQAIIHRPAIHSQADKRFGVEAGIVRQAHLDFSPEHGYIPEKMLSGLKRNIFKAMQVLKLETSAIPATQHYPPTGRAQVYRQEICLFSHATLPPIL